MEQERNIVGMYYRYPDLTGRRQCEGGRRLSIQSQREISENPRVTVITVCKNSEATLDTSIKSVLTQDYKNLEYIIIDGCSSDNTINIIKDYEHSLDYYISEPDNGIYDAMNKGIKLASGDLIIFLNSDDWYENNSISILVSALKYSKCDFVGALARCINPDGSNYVLPRMSFDKSTLLRMPIRHETLLLSADVYNRIGLYNTRYKIIADYEFCIRLYKDKMTYYEVPYPLLNFRTTGVSSINLRKLHSEHAKLLLETFPFLNYREAKSLGNHSIVRPIDFLNIARKYIHHSDFFIAVKAILQDFKYVRGGIWGEAQIENVTRGATFFQPKISIIMPIYNYYCTLSEDINSILNQDIKSIELICINNSKSRNVKNLLELISNNDDRVTLISNISEPSRGKIKNIGIRSAKGEYIFFVDEGGAIPDGILRMLYDTAKAHDSTIVRGAFRIEKNKGGRLINIVKYPANINRELISHVAFDQMPALIGSAEGYWAGLYERNFAESILFPESIVSGGDGVFLTRSLFTARKVTLFPYIVYIDRSKKNIINNHVKKSMKYTGSSFEIDDFILYNKYVARTKLGLSCNKRFIAFYDNKSIYSHEESVLFKRSISLLKRRKFLEDVEVILIGKTEIDIDIPVNSIGSGLDHASLSLLYAAADVFAYPSISDSAPQAVAAALISGTPVVCFFNERLSDIISHIDTGFIVMDIGEESFYKGIYSALTTANSMNSMVRSVRAHFDAYRYYSTRILREIDVGFR